ncbi:hypothetical protein CPB85DRAFT_1315345, partial [Mucidula mucida]
MAYAGAEFALKVVRAAKGETGIIAPTYVFLDDKAKKIVGVDTDYFSARVELGVGHLLSRFDVILPLAP